MLAASACLVAWPLFLSPGTAARYWGVGFSSVLPIGVRSLLAVLASAIAVACCLFPVERSLESGLKRWPLGGGATSVLFSALGAAVSVALPVSHRLLGDGVLRVGDLSTASGVMWGSHGAMSAVSAVHALFQRVPGWEAETAFRAVASLSGALYVFCGAVVADRLGTSRLHRILCFAPFPVTGYILHFFGYPEVYALPGALSAAALATMVVWNGRDGRYLLASTSLCAVAIAAHPSATYLAVPMGLALGGKALDWWGSREPWKAAAVIPPILGGIGVAVWAAMRYADVLASPGPMASGYSLWSAAHLLDQGNEYLLVSPLHMLLCSILIAAMWRRAWPIRSIRFPLAATGSAMAAGFLVNPELGSLDWDLLSFYAVPLCFLTCALIAKIECKRTLVASVGPFGAAALVHAGLWVGANVSPVPAPDLVELMAAQDSHHTAERRVKLGVKMLVSGFEEAAIRQFRAALAADPDQPMALYNLGIAKYYSDAHTSESGLLHLARFVSTAPDSVDTRFAHALVQYHEGDRVTAIALAAGFLLDSPGHSAGRVLIEHVLGERPSKCGEEVMRALDSHLAGRYNDSVNHLRWIGESGCDDNEAVARLGRDLAERMRAGPE